MRKETDYLVIGSGVAGLSFALHAAQNARVMVVTKRGRDDTATSWAQGGIAAVFDPGDSFEKHIEDTLRVGSGLSDPSVVEKVVREGPACINELVQLGAHFSARRDSDAFDLAREGGHSERRVIHAGDITGREVQRVLSLAVSTHPNIEIIEAGMAIDLIELSRIGGPQRVAGAYVLDEDSGEVHTVVAQFTVLATGGAGKVYLYTSNPDISTGDGVAMAYRAGASIANMEFFQFHPTVLFHPRAKNFLISEALRGEGGVLRLPDGKAFMMHHHAMKDLAPRDAVARAIDYEMKLHGHDCVYLDMTHHSKQFLQDRFPNIYERCASFGMDMSVEPIPVVPAAHYMCGGVLTNINGQTSLPGLLAIGEAACTGLHGANRLASNSLLEGLVLGKRGAQHAAHESKVQAFAGDIPDWDVGSAVPSDEAVVVSHNWDEVRRFMWNYVGIVRSDRRLKRALSRAETLQHEIHEYYWTHLVNRDLLELRNIADVAEIIVRCALARRESRGLHYNIDYPQSNPHFASNTILHRNTDAHIVVAA